MIRVHRRIFVIAYREVTVALAAGEDVVFDATSLTVAPRWWLRRLAKRHDAIPIAHYFAIRLSLALARNARRRRSVPAGIVTRMRAILVPPTHAEGFARVVVHPQR